MAGSSMTFSYDESGHVRRVICDWVSDDATGAVSGTCKKIAGSLIKAVTVPSGTAAPTANYDIALTDPNTVDVLGRCIASLANRHTSNVEEVYCLVSSLAATDPGGVLHPTVCDPLTFAVTNAGNSKAGKIILYYRES